MNDSTTATIKSIASKYISLYVIRRQGHKTNFLEGLLCNSSPIWIQRKISLFIKPLTRVIARLFLNHVQKDY